MDRTVQKYQRRNVYSYQSDEQLPNKRQRTNWYEPSSNVRDFTSSSVRGGYSAVEAQPHRGESTPRSFVSLDVRYSDQRVSDDQLLNMLINEFNRFGNCSVRLGRKFSHCEGVAFVDYRYSEDAWRARDSLHNRFMIGKQPVQIDAVYDDKIKVEPDRYSARVRDDQYTRSSASYNSTKNDTYVTSNYSRSDGLIAGRSFSNERDRTRYEPEFNNRVRNPSPYRCGQTERNFDGQKFDNGSRVSIKPHEPMCPEDDELATKSLFVGNLDAEITQEEIISTFEQYGKIEDVDIKRGDGRTRSSTFAFVRFTNLDMAYNCILGARGKSIRGLICKIGYAKSRLSNVVWISGISHSLSLNEVKCGIEQLTALDVVDVRKAGDNPSHACVTFKTIEDASNALRLLRGKTIDNSGHRLRVDYYAEAAGVRGDTTTDMMRSQRSRESGGETTNITNNRTVSGGSIGRLYSDHESTVKSNQFNHTTGTSGASKRGLSNERRNIDLTNITKFAEISDLASTVWSGSLTMKNSRFVARLLHVGGNQRLIEELLDACDSQSTDGTSTSSVSSCQLKISQRLHIDEQKLEDVRRKMSSMEYCILVALPPSEVPETSEDMPVRPLRNLITYLKQKDAAGIVSLPQSNGSVARTKGLLHAFPLCDFSREVLRKYAGKITDEEYTSRDHLVVVVIKS